MKKNMTWKETLHILELAQEWDLAIEFMEEVIQKNPNDMDAYIYMNYLLMNLIVEEEHDTSKDDYYEALAKKYYDESYAKFSDNAEYLFYTALTAVMSPWYFGIDQPDYLKMFERSLELDPDNIIYKCNHYLTKYICDLKDPVVTPYAQLVLQDDSPIQKELKNKGAIGEYLLELLVNSSKESVGLRPY